MKSRSVRVRKSFRRRVHAVTEPKRYEVCNLAFSQAVTVSQVAPSFTLVTRIADIYFAVEQTGSGRALKAGIKALEIGGMVFSYRIALTAINGSVYDDVVSAGTGMMGKRVHHRMIIATDNMDANGNVVAIPDWFQGGSPSIATTAGAPPSNTEDVDYPMRIHWQNYRYTQAALINDLGVTSNGPPTTQDISNPGGSSNLRLRIRLTDRQGLYFHYAVNCLAVVPAFTASYDCRVHGTLYYRYVW